MGETIRYQKPVKIPAAEAAEKFTQVNLHIAFLFGTCSHRFFSERNKAQNRGSQKNTGKTEDNAVFCPAIQLRRIPDDFDEIAGYKGDEAGYGKKCPCQLPPPSAGHTVPEQMIPDNTAHGLETKIKEHDHKECSDDDGIRKAQKEQKRNQKNGAAGNSV